MINIYDRTQTTYIDIYPSYSTYNIACSNHEVKSLRKLFLDIYLEALKKGYYTPKKLPIYKMYIHAKIHTKIRNQLPYKFRKIEHNE